MSKNYEDVYVVWEKEEGEPEHPELEANDGVFVDPNDPQLTEEVVEDNPNANAYGTTLRVKMDLRGSPESIAEFRF
jgi:hypothetical protein